MRSYINPPAMTCRPLPFPSLAPSIIPGKSRSWILAPLYRITPGTVVRVVNSYAATSEYTPAKLVNSVDLPTDGNPAKKIVTSAIILVLF